MDQRKISAGCGGPESFLLLVGKGTGSSRVVIGTQVGNIHTRCKQMCHSRPTPRKDKRLFFASITCKLTASPCPYTGHAGAVAQ